MVKLINAIRGKEQVYTPQYECGLHPAVMAAIEVAKRVGKNINLLYGDTVVTLAPGSTDWEVEVNYYRIRGEWDGRQVVAKS